jgi:exosortase A
MTENNTRSGWPLASALITFLLLLIMILYQQTVIFLAAKWNDLANSEYAHGYLVLAISIYLIVYNRKRLAKLSPCPSYAILPLVFLAVLLWLVAVLVDVQTLETVGLLGVLFAVIWALLGYQVMIILAFPLLFIAFAIPVWFPLSPLLQDITADVVFWLMRVIEVPAFRQENMIAVPAGVFSVEEACSGLRYLLAALTLGSLYAYMNYVSLWGRVTVVFVAAGTALLANILRVFIVIYLGYSTEMQHPWVHDHLMLGWYLFGGLVAVLLFLDARFYRHASVLENAAAGKIAEKMSAEEASDSNISCRKGQLQYFIVAGLCAIILSIGPAIVYQQNNHQQLSGSDIKVTLPAGIEGWSGPMVSENDWTPQYHGAINAKADYLVRDKNVTLFMAYYPFQKQGVEVINDLNRISNNKIWQTKYPHSRVRSLPVHDVMEQVIEKNQNNKRLVWYWYNISGQLTVNKYEAKAMQLAGLLMGQPQAYMVAVSVPVGDDIEQAREFIKNIINDLQRPLANFQATNY